MVKIVACPGGGYRAENSGVDSPNGSFLIGFDQFSCVLSSISIGCGQKIHLPEPGSVVPNLTKKIDLQKNYWQKHFSFSFGSPRMKIARKEVADEKDAVLT